MQWVAIGLSFVAVVVILRYASRPRCAVCRRRHAQPDAAAGPEVDRSAHAGTAISWRADAGVPLSLPVRDAPLPT